MIGEVCDKNDVEGIGKAETIKKAEVLSAGVACKAIFRLHKTATV